MSASVAIRFNAITGDAEKAFTNLTRTVSGFEKSFAGVASSVAGHQERMNRAFSQFSGDKLIAEAHELASAIQRVGGAAKLTDTEQQQVNRTVTEAIAKYRALGLEAPRSLTDLANATARLEQPTTLASKAMGVLGSAFGQFTLANLAANAIQNVIGRMGEFIAQGAKLPGLEASFTRLATSVGENSRDMLNALRDSTRGLVSDIDLMQSANKALLLGLPVTTQEMGELAKTATVLGKAMGLDATQSLNDLITALGRSSPLILDNLGLTVKVGEANEAYAQKLGKSSSALTDAEKKTAFYEAAMEAAREKTDHLGEQSKTLGEIIDTVWVSIGNRITRTSSEINIALGKVITEWKSFEAFVADFSSGGLGFALARASKRDGQSPAAPAPQQDSSEEFIRKNANEQTAALAALETSARKATEPLKALTDQQRSLALELVKGGQSAKEVADQLNGVQSTAGVTERQIQALKDTWTKSTQASTQYRDSVRSLSDELSGKALAGKAKVLTDAFRSLTAEQRKNPAVMNRVADAALELHKAGARLEPELFQLTFQTGAFHRSLPPVITGLDLTKSGLARVTGEVKASAAAFIELNQIMDSVTKKGVFGPPGDVPGFKFGKPEIPEPLPPTFFEQFLPEPQSFTQAARAIAQDAIGSFADAIRTGDWAAFKDSVMVNVARFMGAGIAAGVDFLVPGLGTLLEPLFTALSEKFLSLFDRNKGRDAVKAFAETFGGFEALHRRLATLGPEVGEQLWKSLTQGVGRNNPEQAQRAIQAITDAFARQAEQFSVVKAGVTELVQAHLGAGAQIPAALQASIDKLVEMGVLTRENATELLGLVDTIKPSFAEIQAAAETLGVSVEHIGEGVKQIRFTEQAEQIAAAFATLEEAGADMTAVFSQSVEKIQPLVNEALTFGRELPASMRPFLENMVTLGLLTDEQGNKLTDLSRLNFAEPLTEKIDNLIVKLGELIETITGELGGALDNLGRRRVNIPIGYSVEPIPELNLDTGEPTRGRVPAGPLPVPEPGSTTAVIDIDGRTVAEAVVPHIPGVVKRYGLG